MLGLLRTLLRHVFVEPADQPFGMCGFPRLGLTLALASGIVPWNFDQPLPLGPCSFAGTYPSGVRWSRQ